MWSYFHSTIAVPPVSVITLLQLILTVLSTHARCFGAPWIAFKNAEVHNYMITRFCCLERAALVLD